MAAPGAIAAPFAGSHVSSDAGRLVLPLVEEKVRRPTQTGQASLPPRASVDIRPPPPCHSHQKAKGNRRTDTEDTEGRQRGNNTGQRRNNAARKENAPAREILAPLIPGDSSFS